MESRQYLTRRRRQSRPPTALAGSGVQREAAGYYAPLQHLKREALSQLVSSHELEVPENMYNAVLTGASQFQQGSREEAETRALVGHNLRTRLSGYKEGREYLRAAYLQPSDPRARTRRSGPDCSSGLPTPPSNAASQKPGVPVAISMPPPGGHGGTLMIIEFGENNVDAVVDSLEQFVDSFDFHKLIDDRSLGRDIAMTVVNGIIGRNEEKRGATVTWKDNEDDYAKWKDKKYGTGDTEYPNRPDAFPALSLRPHDDRIRNDHDDLRHRR